MNIKVENLDDLKCKGIYKITNIINDKCYIGSTWRSFKSRYKQHLTKLNQGKHHCQHLQRAFDKYGKDSFTFEIIEIVSEESILLDREAFYINKYNGFTEGYNENPNPNFSPMFNENSKKKSSETHKRLWKELEESMSKEEFLEYKKVYLEERGFVQGRKVWNKGIKMTDEQTKNMKKPKIHGVSEAMKEVHRKNSKLCRDRADYILVYDSNMNWINTFWCMSDLVEYSKSEFNDLPMKLRKGGVRTLTSSKIAAHINDGKLYKGLIFKRAPKSRQLSYANRMNSWKAETEPIMSQAESTLSEGATTTGEVQSS